MKNRILKTGYPYPLGATIYEDTINFAVVLYAKKECGIILYHRGKAAEERIVFSKENCIGNVYCGRIEGINPADYTYNFFADDKVLVDAYAKQIIGNEKWGSLQDCKNKKQLHSGFYKDDYNWENDMCPAVPFEDSILYCTHVRGFTKHGSSGVKGRGTFRGIQEKIPYLKELGVTALELLPAYEFEEVEPDEKNPSIQYMIEHYKEEIQEDAETAKREKLNYWGFKKGFYFAPKASYAMNANGKGVICEMKDMIKELHLNHMELIMQFYFPRTVKQGYILEVLKYWVLEYHIDGIHLLGENIPITLIATEPLFSNTKLMYIDFPCDEIYEKEEQPVYRNLASCQDDFMYDTRKYLKSDEGTLSKFLMHMKRNPAKEAVINYITNYNSLTLMDLVSYDQKHNEENGEDNKDGCDFNYSWNCGIEGRTRKKAVTDLRLQQMKNALVFVILAQGTPLILGGDEFGNTQKGNNNPYCQDNDTTWLNWNDCNKNKEIFLFTKQLVALRKAHPILRKEEEFRIMDTISCGYPDLSYHGEEVWRPVLNNYNRHVGIMYCGKYAKIDYKKEDDFFYIAYNMHWVEHTFALPKLPKGMQWECIMNTAVSREKQENKGAFSEISTIVSPRSVKIYKTKNKK